MSAREIANEEIFAACDALAQEGKKITVNSVHNHPLVGTRGGGGTISQGIKLWRASREAQATPATAPRSMVLSEAATVVVEGAKSSLLATLSTALQSILTVTTTEAQEQVAALVKGLKDSQVELTEERDGILAIDAERERELERLDQSIADLTAQAKVQADESLRKISTLEGQIQGQENQITALGHRHAEAVTVAQAQAVQIAKADERHEADTRAIRDLEQRLADTAALAQKQADENADLKPKLATSQAQEQAAQTRIHDLTAEANAQSTHVSKLESIVAKALVDAKEQAIHIADLRENLGSLKAQLDAARDATKKAQAQAQEWKQLTEKQDAEVSTCQRALSEADNQIVGLKREITEFRTTKKP